MRREVAPEPCVRGRLDAAAAPAGVLAPFIYAQIVWMMALGYFIFGDLPDRWTLIGASVVIASGLYLLYRERVRSAEARRAETSLEAG